MKSHPDPHTHHISLRAAERMAMGPVIGLFLRPAVRRAGCLVVPRYLRPFKCKVRSVATTAEQPDHPKQVGSDRIPIQSCNGRVGSTPDTDTNKSNLSAKETDYAVKLTGRSDLRDDTSTRSESVTEAVGSETKVPSWAKPISCQPDEYPVRRQKYGRAAWKAEFDAYLELTKPRLTALVVLSAMSSYALAPEGGSLMSLGYLTVGTALCSASANAINQGREPAFDRMMTRTRKRPVASYRLTSSQAFIFAGLCGLSGVMLLAYGTNWTVALLGAANILLYGGLYTSMKRTSIWNTWVGAVVGAIPPLMGWATCSSLAAPGPWILAGLLYSWQFPHFMSLSYSIADEYRRAGYIMSAWTNPLLTARVAFRHALIMFPLCFAAAYFGLTDKYFVIDSSLVNGWMAYAAAHFYMQQRKLAKLPAELVRTMGDHKKYARLLFWASVIHLPLILLLAMLHKKGRWDWWSNNGQTTPTSDDAKTKSEKSSASAA